VVEKIPEILELIGKSTDDMVTMQLANAVRIACQKVPGANQKHKAQVMETLRQLSSREMTEDSSDATINAAAVFLFETQIEALKSDKSLFVESLPLLFTYLKKEGTVRYSPYRVIAQVASEQPSALRDYTGEIIGLVNDGRKELSSSLLHLYQVNQAAFNEKIDILLEILQQDSDLRGLVLSVLLEMSKDSPELFVPYVDILVSLLESPVSATSVSMILSEVAREEPESIYHYTQKLATAMRRMDVLKNTMPTVLGLVGRKSEERAAEILTILRPLLDESDQTNVMVALQQYRSLGQMNRDLLGEYISRIKALTDSPQQYIRDTAIAIVDYYEGRDIRSLADRIEEQNRLIREAAVSVDSLKEYLDNNIELLKQFISEIVKKLPVPVRFSTEGRVQKVLRLHFICAREGERCLYPHDREFTTETRVWNKWLKLAVSALSVGVSVINPLEGGALSQVREAYEAYKEGEDADFLAFVNEPFLTASEQDSLVSQLRDAKFFDVFRYDASIGNWVCLMCKQDT
jgi:hypothetical protein